MEISVSRRKPGRSGLLLPPGDFRALLARRGEASLRIVDRGGEPEGAAGRPSLLPAGCLCLAGATLALELRGGEGCEVDELWAPEPLVEALLGVEAFRPILERITRQNGLIPLRLPSASALRAGRVLDSLQAEIAGRRAGPRAGAEALAVARLLELLVIAARCPAEESAGADGRPRTIEELVGVLDEGYAERYSLAEVVSSCAMNTSDFSRRFKARTGYPLFEYINRLRVKRAAALLKRTDMGVLDIALAVGYNNLSFFNRYFRRLTGLTPAEYRRSRKT